MAACESFYLELNDLSLSFADRECFAGFSTTVYGGERIAVIGRNGVGKSSLLEMVYQRASASGLRVGLVPQIIDSYPTYSGGERFNKVLSMVLADDPALLLLDEPTNHLDQNNRHSLLRKLEHYSGTLIMVTHDREILRKTVDRIWHIVGGRVVIFCGQYDDYIKEQARQSTKLQLQLRNLKEQQKLAHTQLMQEQQRMAKSKAAGEAKIRNKRWMKVTGDLKAMRADKSQGRRLKGIGLRREQLMTQLNQLCVPEVIVPHFEIPAASLNHSVVIAIKDASVGYDRYQPILKHLNLTVRCGDRVAIVGNNGCGKSTLLRAIVGDSRVVKTGEWYLLKPQNIGFLEQHYAVLTREDTPLEAMMRCVPSWSYTQIREHLNSFLFRKNREVTIKIKHLSGGEKARLSLAIVAANPPKLLVLDEVTNNLDLETYEHMIQVLVNYPGSMLVVSHDFDFLQSINALDNQLVLPV